MDDRPDRLSFGAVAARYDRVRPTYPPAAVEWALGVAPVRVVDLGAGTGLLTRVLVGLGHDVVPVEPDPGMRARLDAATAPVRALAGEAEAIPLPDASVDAVVAGQSYHWFDPPRAHAEIARILRPGGTFAPIWNVRDESVPWLRQLAKAMRSTRDTTRDELAARGFGRWFGPIERGEFRHAVEHTVDDLIELVKSRSYYLTASAQIQSVIEASVRDLMSSHTDLRGRNSVEVPYVTEVYRARLLAAP